MIHPICRPMQLSDLDEIMILERQCFREPWTRHMYITDLTDNSMASYLVLVPDEATAARSGGRLPSVLAYGGMWLMVDAAHIATLCSHPAWRGCGFAERVLLDLLDVAIGHGAMVSTLEVRVSNMPARRLYERLGYQVAGVRRRYYRDGEDGLIMTTSPLHEEAMADRLKIARSSAGERIRQCLAAKD